MLLKKTSEYMDRIMFAQYYIPVLRGIALLANNNVLDSFYVQHNPDYDDVIHSVGGKY
jgi:hypothetical protein